MILPLCVAAFLVLPNGDGGHKDRKLDFSGVGALTVGLVLFVYSISDASTAGKLSLKSNAATIDFDFLEGWNKPQIIVTLIFSVVLISAFFFIETKVQDPAVPPRIWFMPNVALFFLYILTIHWFLYVSELQLVEIFEDLFGWSALNASLHCIPLGIASGTASFFCARYGSLVPRRLILAGSQVLMGIAVLLFALADSPDKYWSHTFLGMVFGLVGVGAGYWAVNVALMASAPKGEEGVFGALINTGLQLGATIGLAGTFLIYTTSTRYKADVF